LISQVFCYSNEKLTNTYTHHSFPPCPGLEKITVLTFSTEDPAQTLPYSMAGKPQLMVLQREKKVPNIYRPLSSGTPDSWYSAIASSECKKQ
jgi:hypothetical protein